MLLEPRDKLLRAAIELFARKGYAAVSIRELAQAAAVNSAMVSYYFGGKEGLYAEALEEEFRRFAETMEEALLQPAPPEGMVRNFAGALLRFHRSHPCWLRLYYSELSNPTPCFATVVQKYIPRVGHLVVERIAAGGFRSAIEPMHALLALVGMLNYYYLIHPLLAAQDPRLITETERAEAYFTQAVDIFLHGMLVTP